MRQFMKKKTNRQTKTKTNKQTKNIFIDTYEFCADYQRKQSDVELAKYTQKSNNKNMAIWIKSRSRV